MSENATSAQPFKWNENRQRAARGLADGKTQKVVAEECSIDRTTLYRWLEHPEFSAAVDDLTLVTGISLRAERLRIIKRVIHQKAKEDSFIKTNKDLLDWIKQAQSETSGSDLVEQLVTRLAGTTTEDQ